MATGWWLASCGNVPLSRNPGAMHGRPGIFRSDEQIRTGVLLRQHVGRAAGMKLNDPRKEIGFLRNDVAVLANPGNLPIAFHVAEKVAKGGSSVGGKVEGFGEFDFIQSTFREEFENAALEISLAAALGRRLLFAWHAPLLRKAAFLARKCLLPCRTRTTFPVNATP